MDLPKNEAVIDFNVEGETTGKRYEGTFTVLCILNMMQKHSMELEKTRLLGDYNNPTDGLVGIAVILSTLRAKIIDAPEWWKQGRGADLLDEEVVVKLFNQVNEAEAKWREKLKEKAAPKTESTSTSSTL